MSSKWHKVLVQYMWIIPGCRNKVKFLSLNWRRQTSVKILTSNYKGNPNVELEEHNPGIFFEYSTKSFLDHKHAFCQVPTSSTASVVLLSDVVLGTKTWWKRTSRNHNRRGNRIFVTRWVRVHS